MKNKVINWLVIVTLVIVSHQVSANITGWTTIGNSGVSSATDGVVTIPSPYSSVNWISTDGGVTGNNGGYGGTDGSTVTSNAFAVTSAGSALTFAFDFVTSDGTITFPDYAWANLYNASDNSLVATLFTATTNPSGSTVPGIGAGLPAISATITPSNASVFTGPGSTDWSPLGASSGTCYIDYTQGCGNTGWVGASYNVLSPGNYYLTFGVANAGDQEFDTGMAFVGTAIGGVPIEDEEVAVPEPTTIVLMAIGLAALATRRRSLISNNIDGFLRA
jgi:hypothetical protein